MFPRELPPPEELQSVTSGYIHSLIASSSLQNATYEADESYKRAEWFAEGCGRAYVGSTESMSRFSETQLQKVKFKPMPWSDNPAGNGTSLFYSDVIGLNASLRRSHKERLAIELANLMASTRVIGESFGPYEGQGPQYLMPVRHSVFRELGARFPEYEEMYEMVQGIQPVLFKMGDEVRNNIPFVADVFKSILSENEFDQKAFDEDGQSKL